MKIKKLVSLTCAFVMALSICVAPASAANVQDTNYYRESISANKWFGTQGRYKEDTSKVYVYPSVSPSGTSVVNTNCRVGGQIACEAANGRVYLRDNRKYAITNFVRERGDYTTGHGVYMWLAISPGSASGSMSGVWSPDWTGTGSGVTIV